MHSKLQDLKDAKSDREKELQEKEDKMLNWEERLKEDQAKQMAVFNKQKQAILAKKMAEQNNELLLQANKGSIDAMKEEHMRAMIALETALEIEQARQMEMMQARLKERMKDGEQERIRREIKMSIMMKAKEKL